MKQKHQQLEDENDKHKYQLKMLSNSSAGNKDVIEFKDKEIEQLKVQIGAATNQFRQSDKLRAAAEKKAD